MTATALTETPTLFLSLLDAQAQLFGATLELPTHKWNGTHDWPLAELGLCGEVVGATLVYENMPLSVILALPPEIAVEQGRAIGATLLAGIERGYRRAEAAANE